MQQQSSSRPRDPEGGGRRRPRVVILDAGDEASVAVLELPETLDIGSRFCHSGTAARHRPTPWPRSSWLARS
jgi:hypothetical protein